MTTTTDYAEIASRAALRAREQADDARGQLVAEAAAMAAEATRKICDADALIQRIIGLLADHASREEALDLLHEAGQRSSTARYFACRAAEIAAERPS